MFCVFLGLLRDITVVLQYSHVQRADEAQGVVNMYLITDTFGTSQRAWSRTEAMAWLSKCSDTAWVHDCFGRLVATRIVEA